MLNFGNIILDTLFVLRVLYYAIFLGILFFFII